AREAGRSALDVLCEVLPQVIENLSFGRTMRWNASGVAFSRPIRWMVALHGSQVIPFEFAGLVGGRLSRGMRFEEPTAFDVQDLAAYQQAMAER
ncbi:MAG: glycine--tRNA ligase subunit beta, partial [Anaerolineae bacterium]|nr:glycine--tRNA ligase subunit beta [Anaerolineae bacterium]